MKGILRKALLLLIITAMLVSSALPVSAMDILKPKFFTQEETILDRLPLKFIFSSEEKEEETQPTEPEQTQPEETEPAQEEPIPVLKMQTEKEREYPHYFQSDYPDVRYGNGSIATSGCGIVSLAMVASYMTGHTYTPVELADYFGGYDASNTDRMLNAASKLQLPWHQAENWHECVEALEKGCPVIVLENEQSKFTQTQHFIVLTGITEEGRILVLDSAKSNYDLWDLKYGFEDGFTQEDICAGYSGAWIFDIQYMPEEPFIYQEAPRPDIECRYPDIQLTLEEENLLARLVWVESRGEPAEGQQAVAEVVLNRMLHEDFSDTLNDVIYGENQFRSVPFLEDATPTQTQYDAIENALYGPYVLPIDVVHFATKAVNENVWGTIGGHTFCYQWSAQSE